MYIFLKTVVGFHFKVFPLDIPSLRLANIDLKTMFTAEITPARLALYQKFSTLYWLIGLKWRTNMTVTYVKVIYDFYYTIYIQTCMCPQKD